MRLDALPQALDLGTQLAVLSRAFQRDRQRIHRNRLDHEVVGTRANRADRAVQAAERRHHDDADVGAAREHALAQLETAHPVEMDIGQHDVEILTFEELERLVRRHAPNHLVSAGAETLGGELTHALVVVDHENTSTHCVTCLQNR